MNTIWTALYLVSAGYIIYTAYQVIAPRLKRDQAPGAHTEELLFPRGLTMALLVFAAAFVALDFYSAVMRVIPEDKYTIKAELKVRGDTSTYSLPIRVEFFSDIEYPGGDEDPNYLVKGASVDNATVRETFWVLDPGRPSLNLTGYDSFKFESWDGFPDEIRPGESYDVDFIGSYVTERDRRGNVEEQESSSFRANIDVPHFTKGYLNISVEDSIEAVSVSSKVEHSVLLIAAIISAFICLI